MKTIKTGRERQQQKKLKGNLTLSPILIAFSFLLRDLLLSFTTSCALKSLLHEDDSNRLQRGEEEEQELIL